MEKSSQWKYLLFKAHYDTLLKVAFRYVSTYEQAVEMTYYKEDVHHYACRQDAIGTQPSYPATNPGGYMVRAWLPGKFRD